MKPSLRRELSYLFLRYMLITLIGLIGINTIYLIFTPLTVYPVLGILKFFYSSITLENNTFVLGDYIINIIPACIAGAAYYLLIILNLATPMQAKNRTKSLVFILLSFLVLNITRLLFFSALFFAGYRYFDIAHKIVWFLGSTLLVVIIWFVNITLFKIKAIPAYTDLKNLVKLIK